MSGDNRIIIREEGMINQLPDSLLCEILANLSTKDVIKTGLVCLRWRNLWKAMPALDMVSNIFLDSSSKYIFLNRFQELNSEVCVERVKLRFVGFRAFRTRISQTILNTAVEHRIKHLDLGSVPRDNKIRMPPTIYTLCESLVSLKLYRAVLPKPGKSVSLPLLKMLDLQQMEFGDSLAMEMLISGCPVLEDLAMDNMYGVRVLSQSLLRFLLTRSEEPCWRTQGVMETPRLKYLKMGSQYIERIIVNDLSSLVTLDLVGLNTFCQEGISSFLTVISCVRNLICSASTLPQVTGKFSELKTVPQLYSLSILSIKGMVFGSWECLSCFLESTPTLKSLFMEFEGYYNYGSHFGVLPHCVLSSLEFVEVKAKGLADLKELWSYFMENSRVLKKFTLWLVHHINERDRVILKELFAVPRRSETCEVVVWSRPPGTYKPWSLASCAF